MEIKTKLKNLQIISYSPSRQIPSLIDRLYQQKPERGGSKVAYHIASLRASVIRLLGTDSSFESTRQKLMDEHHEPLAEGASDNPIAEIEPIRQFKSPDDAKAFVVAVEALLDVEVEFTNTLFTVEQIDAAGYPLSGAEIDALMGLLIQPEPIPA